MAKKAEAEGRVAEACAGTEIAQTRGATMNDAANVTENLHHAAWKLQGIAGLFKVREEGSIDVILNAAEADGLSMILKDISEDIFVNADLITEAKQPS